MASGQDVIEEVLQDEIIDETDNAEMSALVSSNSLGEHGRQMTNPSELLQFFDHKLHGEKLSRQEVKAILSFLINNVEVGVLLLRYALEFSRQMRWSFGARYCACPF